MYLLIVELPLYVQKVNKKKLLLLMSDLDTHFLTFTISIIGIFDWIYLFGNRHRINKYYRFLTEECEIFWFIYFIFLLI